MKQLLASLCCLGALLLAGCSSAPPMAGLGLELASIERRTDGSAVATVRIVNPNTVAYNVASASHRIFLGDRAVGTLEISKPIGVPAQNVGLHTGPLKLESGAALPAGTVAYRLESRVTMVLWGDRSETNKLSGRGTVEVK
jgi:hypothetical protein